MTEILSMNVLKSTLKILFIHCSNVDYKETFNLGYELTKELNLKSPIFSNNNPSNSPSNAIEEGMLQYIGEVSHSKNLDIGKSLNQRKNNNGRGLTH